MTRRIFDKLTGTNATSASRSLEVATELLRQGQVPIAQRAEERSRISINDLTQGIERAAERVLGDDAQALQRAQRELDQLASEVQREIGLDDAPPGSANPTAGEPTDAPRTPTQQPGPPSADRSSSGPPPEGNNQARGESRQPALENLLPGNNNTGGGGPIIGGDFTSWSDRLREVEDMVDLPDLRNDIANARGRAREFRLEYRRAGKKPDWAVVRLQVVRPLVEVRDQIAQELARRQPEQNLVPLDRDPVPSSYAERVRRYYEALSRETQGPATPQPRSSP
jgi:hypothetical protein